MVTSVVDSPVVIQHRKTGALLRLLEVLRWQPHRDVRVLRVRARHRQPHQLPVGMRIVLADRDVLDLGTADRDKIVDRTCRLGLAEQV